MAEDTINKPKNITIKTIKLTREKNKINNHALKKRAPVTIGQY